MDSRAWSKFDRAVDAIEELILGNSSSDRGEFEKPEGLQGEVCPMPRSSRAPSTMRGDAERWSGDRKIRLENETKLRL